MSGIIDTAMYYAEEWHRGQKRKYTNEPYIVHPFAVVALVRHVTDDPEITAAAFLHDVMEDCGISIGVLTDVFGARVAALVDMLTDVSRPEDGNRRVRKQLDLEHTARACPEAKTIKLADLIDNTKSIVAFDPQFARVYLEEKRRLLDVLREGDAALWDIACNMVQMHRRAL